MTIRAKFNVSTVAKHFNGGGASVTMSPVVGDAGENKTFWDATPSGKIEMHITNPDAIKVFENGGEFYVDFTKAD